MSRQSTLSDDHAGQTERRDRFCPGVLAGLAHYRNHGVRGEGGGGTNGTRLRFSPPNRMETIMSFGKGVLLWLIGIPIPIILLLAVFMHH